MAQRPRTEPTLSRRDFFKLLLGMGVGAGATSLGLSRFFRWRGNGEQPTTPITPANTLDPLTASNSDLMHATATTIAARRETSSFHESKNFSREFFETVRKAVVYISLTSGGEATAWFAPPREPGTLDLITNWHVARQLQDVTMVNVHTGEQNTSRFFRVVRPNIDKKFMGLTAVAIETHPQLDLARITVRPTKEVVSYFADSLSFIDLYDPARDSAEAALIVGFPGTFRENRLDTTAFATGTEIPLHTALEKQEGYWITPTPNTGGASGSPVVINRGGVPYVIGVAAQVDNGHRTWLVPLDLANLKQSWPKPGAKPASSQPERGRLLPK